MGLAGEAGGGIEAGKGGTVRGRPALAPAIDAPGGVKEDGAGAMGLAGEAGGEIEAAMGGTLRGRPALALAIDAQGGVKQDAALAHGREQARHRRAVAGGGGERA